MNISGLMRTIPGGVILLPMCAAAVINTISPGIALKFAGPCSGIFANGAMTMVGMILFAAGSQIRLNQLGTALARGGVLTAARLVIGYAVALLVVSTLGRTGTLWGIPAMAYIIIGATCNPGIYMGLMESFGDSIDRAAFGVLNIIAVPTTPLILMDLAGGYFNYAVVMSTVLPFLVGLVVGNADRKMAEMLAPANSIALFFMGFSFGSQLDIMTAVSSGLNGIILVLFSLLLLPVMIAADRFILGRPGYAAAAISTVGGMAIAAPSFIAQSIPDVPEYAYAARIATPQIALAMIIVAVVFPFISKALYKTNKK